MSEHGRQMVVGGEWEEVKRRTKHQQRRFCRTFSLDSSEILYSPHAEVHFCLFLGGCCCCWMDEWSKREGCGLRRERERGGDVGVRQRLFVCDVVQKSVTIVTTGGWLKSGMKSGWW